MEEKINAWSERALGPEPECTLDRCEKCPDEEPPLVGFKRYDKRSRIFQWLEGEVVKRMKSWGLRWKCLNCGRLTIELPDFALPYKRYVVQTVLDTTAKFATGTLASMSGVVVVGDEAQAAVTYVDVVDGKWEVSREQMWQKTVRGWCRWLAGLEEVLGVAKRLSEPFRKERMQSRVHRHDKEYGSALDLVEREKEIREHLHTSVLTHLIRLHARS